MRNRRRTAAQLAQTIGIGVALIGAAVLAILILTAAFRIGERALPEPLVNERPLVFTVPGPARERPGAAAGAAANEVALGGSRVEDSSSREEPPGLIELDPPIDVQ